jgi:uncharacterized RDD family membrane protein YckC
MADPRPAGFWIRAAAAALDLLLVTVVERSFVVVARLLHGVAVADAWTVSSMVTSFAILFAAVYGTALHAATGQTIGKRVLGIRVVALDGRLPSVGQAFLRWLGYAVSAVPVGLGFAMAGWRHDRRALHDLLAGTRVERVETREPSAPAPEPEPAAVPLGPPTT